MHRILSGGSDVKLVRSGGAAIADDGAVSDGELGRGQERVNHDERCE
jgi:hypothetical protein